MTVLDESSRIEASLLDELDVLVGSAATQSPICTMTPGKKRSSLVVGTPASPSSSNIPSNDCAEANCITGHRPSAMRSLSSPLGCSPLNWKIQPSDAVSSPFSVAVPSCSSPIASSKPKGSGLSTPVRKSLDPGLVAKSRIPPPSARVPESCKSPLSTTASKANRKLSRQICKLDSPAKAPSRLSLPGALASTTLPASPARAAPPPLHQQAFPTTQTVPPKLKAPGTPVAHAADSSTLEASINEAHQTALRVLEELAEDKCRLDCQMASDNDELAEKTLNAVAGRSSTGSAVCSMGAPSIAQTKQNADADVEATCNPRSSAGLVEMGMEELRNLVQTLRSDLLEQQASRGEKIVKELRDEMQAVSKKLDEEKEGHRKMEAKLEEALGRERALQEAQQVHAKELEEAQQVHAKELEEAQQVHAKELEDALGRERALQEAQQVHAKELEYLKTANRQLSATSALQEDDMLEKERIRLELQEAHAALEEAYTEIDQAKTAQTAAEKAASGAVLKVESAERERERAKEEATRAVKEKDEAIKMLEAAKAEGEGMAEVLTARRGAAGSGIGSFNAIWDLDGTALACKASVAIVSCPGSDAEDQRYEHVTVFISARAVRLVPNGGGDQIVEIFKHDAGFAASAVEGTPTCPRITVSTDQASVCFFCRTKSGHALSLPALLCQWASVTSWQSELGSSLRTSSMLAASSPFKVLRGDAGRASSVA